MQNASTKLSAPATQFSPLSREEGEKEEREGGGGGGGGEGRIAICR